MVGFCFIVFDIVIANEVKQSSKYVAAKPRPLLYNWIATVVTLPRNDKSLIFHIVIRLVKLSCIQGNVEESLQTFLRCILVSLVPALSAGQELSLQSQLLYQQSPDNLPLLRSIYVQIL